MTKEKAQNFTTLAIGILIGFVLGFSFTLNILWSTLIFEKGLAESPHSQLRQLRRSDNPERSNIRKPRNEDIGWKNIHVFYGDESHLSDASDISAPYFKANKWFSQVRQDEIVSRLFHSKRGGYFIDLAANDPVRISNTYALETSFNWNGLCLEPNPVYWSALSHRKCDVVAAIIGDKTMEEVSFIYPKGKPPKGGILGNEFDNKDDKYNESHPRFTVSLVDVFQKFRVPKIIDYISLDVEGAEDLVMSSFPFDQYRFNVMTVERPSDKLSALLTANGYLLLKTLKKGIETIWTHESIYEDLDKSALDIDSENYKYTEREARERIIPEEEKTNRV